MEKNYFLKPDYESLKINMTLEKNREPNKLYWNENRINIILKDKLEYQHLIYEKAKDYINKYNLKTAVDVGCGFTTKLEKYVIPYCETVYGFDQLSAIEANKKYLNNNVILNECDFDNESTLNDAINLNIHPDLIICSDVIEHVVYPDILLNFIKNISTKDTIIIISTPERDLERGINNCKSNKKEHVREWNQSEFNNYIKYHNFEIIEHILMDKSTTDNRKLNQVVVIKKM